MSRPALRPIRRHTDIPGLAHPAGYAQVVEAHAATFVFVSGQAGLNDCDETVEADMAAQAAQAFRNLGIALAAAGCDASHLVKMTVLLRDLGDLPTYRIARDRFFASVAPLAAPAVTLFGAADLYRPDVDIEIDAIAARP